MALDNFLEWSITAASNIDVAGINIQNTGLVSQGDDGMRAIMAWAAQGFRTVTYLMDTATMDLRGSNISTQIFNVAGTATVTTVNLEDTQFRLCKIESARQFTASASLIVNNSTTVNHTCAAGDIALFIGDPSSVVRMWILTTSRATVAQMEAGTEASVSVTPAVQHRHPSAAKVWALVTISGGVPSIALDYGADAVVDNGAGDYSLTFTTSFSTANYIVLATARHTTAAGNDDFAVVAEYARGNGHVASSVRLVTSTYSSSSALVEMEQINVACFGDL